MKKIAEHTYGSHVYMKVEINDGSVHEVDMFLSKEGKETFKTTGDYDSRIRTEIIKAFNEFY